MKTQRPSAFSVIELLVVIAIIAILLMLLLPALTSMRERGRQIQCMNHQRNIVFAMIEYEATHAALPSAVPVCSDEIYNSLGRQRGAECLGPNWASQILGFIEEDHLYEDLQECMNVHWNASDDCPDAKGQLGRFTPSYMVCPSAPEARKLHLARRTGLQRLSKANYAACLGAEHYRTAIETKYPVPRREADDELQAGAISVVHIPKYRQLVRETRLGRIPGAWKLGHRWGTKTKQIDKLSKTILLSEVLTWDGAAESQFSEDIRGVWVSPAMGASTYTHKFGPNSSVSDRLNACDTNLPATHPLHCEQIAAEGPESAETWASARSGHPNGVIAAMADGSVAFYADDIHIPVWQALATRSGGDNVVD